MSRLQRRGLGGRRISKLTLFGVLAVGLCLLTASLMRAAPAPTPVRQVAQAQDAPQTDDVRPPIVTPQARRYAQTRNALAFLGTAYELIMLWGVLASGLSARLRTFVQPLRFSFFRLIGYYVLLTLVLLVLHAPLTYYSGYYLSHAYGLSSQSLWAWLGDLAKGVGVDAATSIPVYWLLFWLIKRSPRRWALWFWAALIPIIAFGIFAAPLIVEPRFNTFTPLPSGPLRTHIEALAARVGIPNAPIFVVDKSKQTHETNAYVTGIGPSARIVLWDTTLQRMPEDQILAVVAHEMGHYVLKHLYWGFLMTVVALLFVLPLMQRFVERLLARFGPAWGIAGSADFAALPALRLTLTLFGFLLAPATNAVSRAVEHQADAYGLQVTQNRPAMARAFVSLAEQNLDDPNPPPLVKFWLLDHPPLQDRIDFALGRK